jgi:hypothetical protein
MGDHGQGRRRRSCMRIRIAISGMGLANVVRVIAGGGLIALAFAVAIIGVFKGQPLPPPGGRVQSFVQARLAGDSGEAYLAFCPYGQLNNQRTELANAAALARDLNRTLVIVDQIALYSCRWSDLVDLRPVRSFLGGRLVLLPPALYGPPRRGDPERSASSSSRRANVQRP